MMPKVQTLKVSFGIGRHVQRDGFACRGEGQREKLLGFRMIEVNALRELQSASGENYFVATKSFYQHALECIRSTIA